MKCPECGKECRKGVIEARDGGNTQLFVSVIWYPEEEADENLRKGTIHLSLSGEAYYCDECMKVFAAFREK